MAPAALVYGTAETPEFQRQSRDFAAALKAAGKPMSLSVMEGYNHFEVMEQLGNPYSLFGRAVLEQMRASAQPKRGRQHDGGRFEGGIFLRTRAHWVNRRKIVGNIPATEINGTTTSLP